MDIEEILTRADTPLTPDVVIDNVSMQEGLQSLRDSEAAVIVLTASGFKQAEISSILGISRTTVWNKNSSGLSKLRMKLKR